MLLLSGSRTVSLPNLSPEPHRHFVFDPRHLVTHGEPRGILHSHPLGEDGSVRLSPSALDMENQVRSGLPWGLSAVDRDGDVTEPLWWGDQLPVRELVGRVFVHGITDCYSLIRDWYRLRGITLPEFPRDEGWHNEGGDLYERGFERAGFRRVPASDIRPGDVFLCRVHSRVLNHGGVYLGDGTLLHHLYGQVSRRTPASRWHTRLDFVVRHPGLEEASC